MPPMLSGHPPMGHPMNSLPVMMMNKPPINMPIMTRPFMNIRKPDGKIDVIGMRNQFFLINFKFFEFKVLLIKHHVDKCLIH
jgi:hypothetical protein